MTNYKQQDIILVDFGFSEGVGSKKRPALIISSNDYHKGRQEVIIAAVTSRTDRALVGDHLITDWRGAGLLFPSVATGIIRTIKQGMIARKLGMMPQGDMSAIDEKLRDALGLRLRQGG